MLKNDEFRLLQELIYDLCGISLRENKKAMLAGRLNQRLRRLGLESYGDYLRVLRTPGSEEIVHLIDAVSTNKTCFFREQEHFDILRSQVLPAVWPREGGKLLRVWSAGCSSGQEPYSLAILLSDYAGDRDAMDFTLLATDISSRMLATAAAGMYSDDELDQLPRAMLARYFMRGRGARAGWHRIIPELRAKMTFRRMNMVGDFGMQDRFDIIFCRNVMIYFDRPTRERLLEKFAECLSPQGYLFVGHAEAMVGGNSSLFRRVDAAVYQRRSP
ncbi:MAG: protein-glutamate O-methyltransferase CheR [Thermodesulfobacteriota bacterium]